MSTVNNGPQIVKNGLVLNLDASARRSYLPNSYINMNNWTVSNGSVTDYNQNGSTIENQRTLTTNPWGNNDIIWGSYPSGDGEADGGWSTSGINIDKSKLYRFSVWMKRTSSTTGGTAYLGGTAWDAAQYLKRTVDGVDEPNPYWYYSNISSFTQNVWYLVVGHLYPYNTTYTGRHPDSGLYNAGSAVKVADIGGNTVGGDFKFSSTSTYAYHRVFHYYCGDNTSRLQFYDPRVDLVDGKQPSITELVNYSPAQWRDLSGNGNNGVLTNKPTYNSSNKGIIVFDYIDDAVTIAGTLGTPSTFTLSAWVRSSNISQAQNIFNANPPFFLRITSSTIRCAVYTGSWIFVNGNITLSSNVWYNLVLTYDQSYVKGYVNGVLDVNSAKTGTPIWGGAGSIRLGYTTGGEDAPSVTNIAVAQIYNRALSASEISQNYEATKTRFGL
jgi:hypothetical protein